MREGYNFYSQDKKDRPMSLTLIHDQERFVAHIRALMDSKCGEEIPLLSEGACHVEVLINAKGYVDIELRFIEFATLLDRQNDPNCSHRSAKFADILSKTTAVPNQYCIGLEGISWYSHNFMRNARWDRINQKWCDDLPYGVSFHSESQFTPSVWGYDTNGEILIMNFVGRLHCNEEALKTLRENPKYENVCQLIRKLLALNPS